MKTQRPEPTEYADYYHRYVSRVDNDDVVSVLQNQTAEMLTLLEGISDEQSLHRYEPGKWSIRELVSHVNDGERVFLFRALWFARGFTDPLPSFDQEVAVAAAQADKFSWASHIDDFRSVRQSSLSFLNNLPEDGWDKSGVASGSPVTVRALVYVIAGHADHHAAILRERYLVSGR